MIHCTVFSIISADEVGYSYEFPQSMRNFTAGEKRMFFIISNIKALIKRNIRYGLQPTIYEEMPLQEH